MEIIDAQIHQPLPLTPWDTDCVRESQTMVAVELAIAAMEAAGVDAAVAVAKPDFVAAAHARYPDKFVGVISIRYPKDQPDIDGFMERVSADQALVGVRLV